MDGAALPADTLPLRSRRPQPPASRAHSQGDAAFDARGRARARRALRGAGGAKFERAACRWLGRDYRSALDVHLLPAFGDRRIETITTGTIEAWRADRMGNGTLPRRTAEKLLAMLSSIFERARKTYRLPTNPARDVERLAIVYRSERFDFYPEEVWALVRAAESEQIVL